MCYIIKSRIGDLNRKLDQTGNLNDAEWKITSVIGKCEVMRKIQF